MNENWSHWFRKHCTKAYLPTYSECRHLAEFVLATRNPETRQEIADQYGFTETVGTIEELIEAKIDACLSM